MQIKESDYIFDLDFSLATTAVHLPPEPLHGSINTPIYLSSTFEQKAPGESHSNYLYTRVGNPTTAVYEETLAKLEKNAFGIAFSSGTAAMVTAVGLLNTGDCLLSCIDLYGGYQGYFSNIAEKKNGIKVDFIDMTDIELVRKSITGKTKMIWIETPANPTLKLLDIKAICDIAKEHNIVTVADNTFCSPYLQTPSDFGVDITLNSGTKYLGGHSDLLYGTLSCNNKDLYQQLKTLSIQYGGTPSPQDSYLMIRSLKTLEVRIKQQIKNAYAIAIFLEKHDKIDGVLYPGLENHPQYKLARTQMRGGGGIVSFYLKGNKEQTIAFTKQLKYFILAFSLGGVESLIEIPSSMTHGFVPLETKLKLGITDNLIRISVGLENYKDLIADISQALDKLV